MNFANLRRAAFAAGFAAFALTACVGSSSLPDDPFKGGGPALGMVLINHTDRYAVDVYVDRYWVGFVDQQSGGRNAACCFPGVKDWSKPITIKWTWGQESNRETKQILKVREQRSMVATLPADGPHQDPDWHKSDAYLCVILRDLNTAALAFSPSASGCATK